MECEHPFVSGGNEPRSGSGRESGLSLAPPGERTSVCPRRERTGVRASGRGSGLNLAPPAGGTNRRSGLGSGVRPEPGPTRGGTSVFHRRPEPAFGLDQPVSVCPAWFCLLDSEPATGRGTSIRHLVWSTSPSLPRAEHQGQASGCLAQSQPRGKRRRARGPDPRRRRVRQPWHRPRGVVTARAHRAS